MPTQGSIIDFIRWALMSHGHNLATLVKAKDHIRVSFVFGGEAKHFEIRDAFDHIHVKQVEFRAIFSEKPIRVPKDIAKFPQENWNVVVGKALGIVEAFELMLLDLTRS